MKTAPISSKHFRSLSRSTRISRLRRSGCQISLPKHHTLINKRIETYTSRLRKARKELHYSKLSIRNDEFDKILDLAAKLIRMLSYLFPRNSADDLPRISGRDVWAYPALMDARQEQFHSQKIFEQCCTKFFTDLSEAQVIKVGLSMNRGNHSGAKRIVYAAQMSPQSTDEFSLSEIEESVADAIEHIAFHETANNKQPATGADESVGNESAKQIPFPSKGGPNSQDDVLGAGALDVHVKLELDDERDDAMGAGIETSQSTRDVEQNILLYQTPFHNSGASVANKENNLPTYTLFEPGSFPITLEKFIDDDMNAKSRNEDSESIKTPEQTTLLFKNPLHNLHTSATNKENKLTTHTFREPSPYSTMQEHVACGSTGPGSSEGSDGIEYQTTKTTVKLEPLDERQLFMRVHSTIRRLQKRKHW